MKCGIENKVLAEEILAFFDWLETNSVGTSGICLWFALLHTWHKAGCPVEFAVARSTLEGKTGLKKDAFYEARNQLRQSGRITWRERQGRQASVYKLISFYQSYSDCVGMADTTADNNPTQPPTQDCCVGIPETNSNTNAVQSVLVSALPTQPPTQSDFVSAIPTISSRSSRSNKNYSDYITPPPNNVSEIPTQQPKQDICVGTADTTADSNPTQQGRSPFNPFSHYEQLFGLLRPMAIEEIKDYLNNGLEEKLVCLAMDRSHENGAGHWNYAKRILDRCVIENVCTVEAFVKKEEQHRIQRAIKKPMNGGVRTNGINGGYTETGEQQNDPYKNITSVKL